METRNARLSVIVVYLRLAFLIGCAWTLIWATKMWLGVIGMVSFYAGVTSSSLLVATAKRDDLDDLKGARPSLMAVTLFAVLVLILDATGWHIPHIH